MAQQLATMHTVRTRPDQHLDLAVIGVAQEVLGELLELRRHPRPGLGAVAAVVGPGTVTTCRWRLDRARARTMN